MGKPEKPKSRAAQGDVPSTKKIGRIHKKAEKKKRTQAKKKSPNKTWKARLGKKPIGQVSGFIVTQMTPHKKETSEAAGGDVSCSNDVRPSGSKHVRFAESHARVGDGETSTAKSVPANEVPAAGSNGTVSSRLATRTFSARGSPSMDSPTNESDAHFPKKRKRSVRVGVEDADVRRSTTASRHIFGGVAAPRRILSTPSTQGPHKDSEDEDDMDNSPRRQKMKKEYRKGTPYASLNSLQLRSSSLDDEDGQLGEDGHVVESATASSFVMGKVSLEAKFHDDPLHDCESSSVASANPDPSCSATAIDHTLSSSRLPRSESEKVDSPLPAKEEDPKSCVADILATVKPPLPISPIGSNVATQEQAPASEPSETPTDTLVRLSEEPRDNGACPPLATQRMETGEASSLKLETSPSTTRPDEAASALWTTLAPIQVGPDSPTDTNVTQHLLISSNREDALEGTRLNDFYQRPRAKPDSPTESLVNQVQHDKGSNSPASPVAVRRTQERRPSFIAACLPDPQPRLSINGRETADTVPIESTEVVAETAKLESDRGAGREDKLQDCPGEHTDLPLDHDMDIIDGTTLNAHPKDDPSQEKDEIDKRPRLSDNPSDPVSEIDLRLDEPAEEDSATVKPDAEQLGSGGSNDDVDNSWFMDRTNPDALGQHSPAQTQAGTEEAGADQTVLEPIAEQAETSALEMASRVTEAMAGKDVRTTKQENLGHNVAVLDESRSITRKDTKHTQRRVSLDDPTSIAARQAPASCHVSETGRISEPLSSAPIVDVFKQRRSQIVFDEEEPMETSVLHTPVVSGNSSRSEYQVSPLVPRKTISTEVSKIETLNEGELASDADILDESTIALSPSRDEASDTNVTASGMGQLDAEQAALASATRGIDSSIAQKVDSGQVATDPPSGEITKVRTSVESPSCANLGGEPFVGETSVSESNMQEQPIEDISRADNVGQDVTNMLLRDPPSETTATGSPTLLDPEPQSESGAKPASINSEEEVVTSLEEGDCLQFRVKSFSEERSTESHEQNAEVAETTSVSVEIDDIQDEVNEQGLTPQRSSENSSEDPRQDQTSLEALGLEESTTKETAEPEIAAVNGRVGTPDPMSSPPRTRETAGEMNKMQLEQSLMEEPPEVERDVQSDTQVDAVFSPHDATVQGEPIENDLTIMEYVDKNTLKQPTADETPPDDEPAPVDDTRAVSSAASNEVPEEKSSGEVEASGSDAGVAGTSSENGDETATDLRSPTSQVPPTEASASTNTAEVAGDSTSAEEPSVSRATRSRARTPGKPPGTTPAATRRTRRVPSAVQPEHEHEHIAVSSIASTKVRSKVGANVSSTVVAEKTNGTNDSVKEVQDLSKIKATRTAARPAKSTVRSSTVATADTAENTPRRSARRGKTIATAAAGAATATTGAQGLGNRTKKDPTQRPHNVTKAKK